MNERIPDNDAHKKKVIVNASTVDEALLLGAKQLGIPRNEVQGVVLNRSENNIISVQVSRNSEILNNKAEDLLEKLEEEINYIETEEIAKGLTEDELIQKGIVNNKQCKIERSKYSKARIEGEYTFYENVEYLIIKEYKKINEIPFEKIEYLTDVLPGTDIAVIDLTTSENKKYKESHPADKYSSEYRLLCNLSIYEYDEKIMFTASVKGKVVLFNSLLYVIPGDKDGYFNIYIPSDCMSTVMDIYPAKGDGKQITVDIVTNGLKEKNVIFGIDTMAIVNAIDLVISLGNTIKGVVVARGLEPICGKDAQIQLKFSTEPVVQDFSILPDGRINYKRKANITMAKAGSLLAVITEPSAGIDGMDVFGKPVIAPSGDSKVLCAGENVSVSKDGKQFFADIDGQPVLNKNILNVFQNYYIPGDVDYTSGNIEFEGNVTIRGSILSGIEVKAGGDVYVMGDVDGGIINAGRDVIISGGVIGSNDSIIQCGRNFSAGHLQNAYIEAEGDVIIKKSVFHSRIYSTGNVAVQDMNGVIVGGIVNALKNIEAAKIGSESGAKTVIIAGQDFLIKKMKNQYNETTEFLSRNIDKIAAILKPLLDAIKNGARLNEEQKQKVNQISKKYKELTKNLSIIEAKKKQLERGVQCNDAAIIKVFKFMYSDVTITIKDISLQTREVFQSSKFFINRKTGIIERGPY